MKNFCKVLLLLVIGTSACFANDTAGSARAELERFTKDLDYFQADFTQKVKSQDGRIQDQTHGQLWLQTPDKLRWIYAGEFAEIIVADGKNIWIHDVSLEQVTVKPQSKQASDSPLMILADMSQIDEQFNVTELGALDEMLLLELKSRDAESEFERIILGLDANGIGMMVMEDAFGQRTEIQFQNTLRNSAAESELFTFTPPIDADVVGVAALPE